MDQRIDLYGKALSNCTPSKAKNARDLLFHLAQRIHWGAGLGRKKRGGRPVQSPHAMISVIGRP